MSGWTAGEWAFFVISAIGGISGYAILIVYVASLRHNMPDQWEKFGEFTDKVCEKMDTVIERLHQVEKQVTREIAVKHAVEEWQARESGGKTG